MAKNEQERKIPVFTVIKNGAILKNIFVINKPPPPSPSILAVENEENPAQEDDDDGEEILMVGRHPDCHIMLTHPSISRFHLQIHSKPSSQNLSVVDLLSVHGTWVSEKKIEPCFPVELTEGDTLKIGGSTRVYRLHWIPLSQAYDMDNPFVWPLVVPVAEEKEEENQVEKHQGLNSFSIKEFEQAEEKKSLVIKEKEGICQDEISISVYDKPSQSLDWILEGTASLFQDERSELTPETQIPFSGTVAIDSACLVRSNMSVPEEQIIDKENQIPCHGSVIEFIPETENSVSSLRSGKKFKILANFVDSLLDSKQQKLPDKTENQSPLQEGNELRNTEQSANSSLVLGGVLSEINSEQANKENETLLSLLRQPSEAEMQEKSSMDKNPSLLLGLNSGCSTEEGFPEAQLFEAGNHSPREELEQREMPNFCSSSFEEESVNSSLPVGEVFTEITESKNNQTPQSLLYPKGFKDQENYEISPPISNRTSSHSIWSRRGKPASVLQIQTGRSRGKTKGHDKADVELLRQEDIENKSISKTLFDGFEEKEEEIFTPNKENFSPNTLLLKSLKRKGKLEEVKPSRSYRKSSSKVPISPKIQLAEDLDFSSEKENQTPKVLQEQKLAGHASRNQGNLKEERVIIKKIQPEGDLIFSSDKENQTPKVLQEKKLAEHAFRNQVNLEDERVIMKKRAERMPFQSLVANCSGGWRTRASLSNATTRSSHSVNFSQTMKVTNSSSSIGERRRSWAMVVDATTLLDKESRKSLQLLQVIRELDCLKRRGSLFRRTTEVSSVLEWIEECMVKTKWWIHIQNSVEEGRAVALTPPASPKSLFSEGSSGSFPCGTKSCGVFSAATSFTEIVSPTAEDHILDCALLFRKMKNDGQLVLLCNDVTLKIKAMAEGIICETAQEFRESLVNPFSKRFLWADSSPRGLTWSVFDDTVLRERYTRGPLKNGGDGAKGLKLILLHNSHYAQKSSSVR
ncbi:FHA domain-containing protein PS1-like isoform X3 [Mangifera indica]|uniref:FHA domain-containing protein PS1-like isoform X3 n=1 Tax=Mangifera indica TaxID=29780 RepID=UPI001CF93144|nr:FHA domain-containing protein PS1-like isoform X3 [Mangifera indica]